MRSADNNIFLGQSFRKLLSALLEGICSIGAVAQTARPSETDARL